MHTHISLALIVIFLAACGSDTQSPRRGDLDNGGGRAPAALNTTPQVLQNIDDQTASQGSPINVNVSGNFQDADGDTLTYRLQGLPAGTGISIDANTGVISGSPNAADRAASPLTVQVIADDGNGGTVTDTFIITVNAAGTPVFNGPLPAQQATLNEPYAFDVDDYFSDPDGQQLMFTSPNLPAGLNIDAATGVISGTPTQAGNFNDIVVVATDPDNNTVSGTFDLTVNANGTPEITSPIGDRSGSQNDPLSIQTGDHFVDPEGGPLTYSATGLPAGMSVDPATGEVRGTPTETGVFDVTITATDGNNQSVADQFRLVIGADGTPHLAEPIEDQSGTLNAPFSLPVDDNFADPDGQPLMFSATGLPPGLSIDPDTGLIDGNPSQLGPFEVTVTATDPDGNAVSDSFDLLVNPDGTPVRTTPIDDQITGIGNPFGLDTAPHFSDPQGQDLTFSAVNLPAGLTLDMDTGAISGAATESGYFPVVITATDPDGNNVNIDFGLTVEDDQSPYLLEPIGDHAGSVGSPFTLDTADHFADPQRDPLTFEADNLPAGLSINPNTGQITGNPTVEGEFEVKLTVSDGNNSICETFQLTIGPNGAPGLNDPIDDQVTTLGDGFNLNVSGNFDDPTNQPLMFSADGLPNGVSINPNTGVLSGQATELGGFDVVITAEDPDGNTVSDEFALTVQPSGTPTRSQGGIPDQDATIATPFSVDTGVHFSDPTAQPLTFDADNLPAGLSIDANTGVISGTPTELGAFPIVVTAQDPDGNEVNDTFILRVNSAGANTPPVAFTDVMITNQNVSRTLPLLDNDIDPTVGNNSTLSISNPAANTPTPTNQGGSVVVSGAGVLTYSPPSPAFIGNDSFSYQVTNGTATSASVVANVIVLEGRILYRSDIDSATDPQATTATNNLYLANPEDPDMPTQVNAAIVAGAGVGPAPNGYGTNPFNGAGTLPSQAFYVSEQNNNGINELFVADLTAADPGASQERLSQALGTADDVLDMKPLADASAVIYRVRDDASFSGAHLFSADVNSPGATTRLTPGSFNQPPVVVFGDIDDRTVQDDYIIADNASATCYVEDSVYVRADANTQGRNELFRIDLDTPETLVPLNIALGAGSISSFALSDDYCWLAYTSNQDAPAPSPGTQELFLVDLNAALPNTVKISSVLSPPNIGVNTTANAIKFSPDSNSVFYVANQDNVAIPELYRVDLSLGAPAPNANTAVRVNQPLTLVPPAQAVQADYKISSDSTMVYYRANPTLRNELFAVAVGTPAATTLNQALGAAVEGVTGFQIGRDPNGIVTDKIVYRADINLPLTHELFLIRDLTTPNSELINTPLTVPSSAVFPDFQVSHTGNRVIFNVDFRQATVYELFVVDFDFMDFQFRLSETMGLIGASAPNAGDPNALIDGTDVQDFVLFP